MAAGIGGGLGFFGQLLGGISKFMGQMNQASAQSAGFEAQAAAHEANARISQINAQAALDAGQESKERRERLARAKLGSSATKFLKSGVVLEGSPLAVLGEEAAQEALAAADELHEGRVKATQFQNQATLSRYNAQLARFRGESLESAAQAKAGASLLGGLFRNG